MARLTVERWAQLAILATGLAAIRTAAEILRLHAVRGPAFGMGTALDFARGAVIASAGTWLAAAAHFLGRHRAAIAIAAATVAALLGYRFLVMG